MVLSEDAELDRRVRVNQARLAADLLGSYDFIVCGSGSSGSVVARRLAEDHAVSVLLLEAGGDDDIPSVIETGLWQTNLGGERDWALQAEPNPNLNGRTLTLSMGKVLGGGSSINLAAWARGHKVDWDHFAAESGNDAWSYVSVAGIYRRIENRGNGGIVFIEAGSSSHPANAAAVEAAHVLGVKRFDQPNETMMEGKGGAATVEMSSRNGKRHSVFRAYSYPFMDRPNLTVLSNAFVRRVIIDNNRATGIELTFGGQVRNITARTEVVLSMGAINTPKVLMLSGIGDEGSLRRLGIPVIQHLAGVGRNYQTHLGFNCTWETPNRWQADDVAAAVTFWPRERGLESPDFFACQATIPIASPEAIARFGMPDSRWTIVGALSHPKSRGVIELTSNDPDHPARVAENTLSHPEDVALALKCVENMREVGNAQEMRPYVTREVMPGDLSGDDLVGYLRDAALTYWHYAGTAKMGRDQQAVVDGGLKVYGIENLRIADASIMPRITAANTMAPCVIIGERAAEEIRAEHRLAVGTADS